MKEKLGELTDSRTGKNTQYENARCRNGSLLGIFSQCASFLEHQETLKKAKRKRNVESIFGVMHIPSANQIRNMLDPVTPEALNGTYREIFNRLVFQRKVRRQGGNSGQLGLTMRHISMVVSLLIILYMQ
jgi:hypothetical protein